MRCTTLHSSGRSPHVWPPLFDHKASTRGAPKLFRQTPRIKACAAPHECNERRRGQRWRRSLNSSTAWTNWHSQSGLALHPSTALATMHSSATRAASHRRCRYGHKQLESRCLGRVAFAGDAAHSMSPQLGQAMSRAQLQFANQPFLCFHQCILSFCACRVQIWAF